MWDRDAKAAQLMALNSPPAHFTMRWHDGPLNHEVNGCIPHERVGEVLALIHQIVDEERARSTSAQTAFAMGLAGNG